MRICYIEPSLQINGECATIQSHMKIVSVTHILVVWIFAFAEEILGVAQACGAASDPQNVCKQRSYHLVVLWLGL